MTKRGLALAAALAVVIGLGTYAYLADRSTPAGQAPLAEVDQTVFEELKTAFNAARGQVRVVALLSPT